MTQSDIIATIGVSILLLAFFLQTIKKINTEGIWYLMLNLIGAAITGYASWLINFIPLVVLEGVWVAVSIVGLVKFLKKNNVSREND